MGSFREVACGLQEYASDNFVVPLGVPELYAYDGSGEQISAAGGQVLICSIFLSSFGWYFDHFSLI